MGLLIRNWHYTFANITMKHMKQAFILFCFVLMVLPTQSQTIAKSLYAEYAYIHVPKENVALYNRFGMVKYRFYSDEKFLHFESYQDIPLTDPSKTGPTLRSSIIRERASDIVYVCLSFDTLRIKMVGGKEERASFQKLASAFNSGSSSIYREGKKKTDIQGFSCRELLVKGKFADTISAYFSNQIVLDPKIADFPLYTSSGGAPYGLMLGRDEELMGNFLEFRAIKLEINQPRKISAELASYQLVSPEKGETMMKDLLAKMMVPAPGAGKN